MLILMWDQFSHFIKDNNLLAPFLIFLLAILVFLLAGLMGNLSPLGIVLGFILLIFSIYYAVEFYTTKCNEDISQRKYQDFQETLQSSFLETENVKTLVEIERLFALAYSHNPEGETYYTELTNHLQQQYTKLVKDEKLTEHSARIKERLEHIFKSLEIKKAKQTLPSYERKLVNEIEEAIDNSKDPELVKERLAKLATHVTSLAKDKDRNNRITTVGFWIGMTGFLAQFIQLILHGF